MRLEFLLKSISSIIKKNEKFFVENPEIFLAVQERFEKAAYDDEDEDGGYGNMWEAMQNRGEGLDPEDSDYQDDQDEDYAYASGDKDKEDDEESSDEEKPDYQPASDEEDAAQEEYLKQLENKKQAPQAKKPAEKPAEKPDESMYDDAEVSAPKIKQPEEKTSSRRQWAAKEKYAPHHDEAIKQFVSQGYSPREAERMAGAHDQMDLQQAIRSKMDPSEPSSKMLSDMKNVATEWYANARHKIGLSANPEENPDLHFNSHKNQTATNLFDALNSARDEYKKSISHVKDPKQLSHMLVDFQSNWLKNNQHFFNQAHDAAEKVKNIATENKQRRQERRKEGEMALMGATQTDTERTPTAGDFSNVEGGTSNKEAIRQSAGGFKAEEDAPTQVSTVQDPAYKVATKNPEFIKDLQQKFVTKVAPERVQRLKEIQGMKKPEGSE